MIQWNLLRNVHFIVDRLTEEMSREQPTSEDEETGSDKDGESRGSSSPTLRTQRRAPLIFTEKHRLLKLQLLPLRQVQKDIEDRLGASSREIPGQEDWLAKRQAQEVFVRSNNGWKSSLIPGRRSSDAVPGVPRRNREAEANQTTDVLAGSAQAIRDLWEDSTVQVLLKRQRVSMETLPGL